MSIRLARREIVVAVLAALLLAAGYAALWRGSTGLAALALVLAYTVAVPAAILVRQREGGR